MRHSRTMLALAILAVLTAAIPLVAARAPMKRGKMSRGKVLADVVAASVAEGTAAPRMPATGFAPQSRRGFTAGDQWEPAIVADSHGTIYVLYPQYLGVPGCPTCPSPTMILQVSRDRGATWDAQIAVDPVDGRTVYAAWLQNRKSDTVVARSDDLGRTWSVVLADRTNAGTDKPILAVRGPHVYVGFNHVQKVWVALRTTAAGRSRPRTSTPTASPAGPWPAAAWWTPRETSTSPGPATGRTARADVSSAPAGSAHAFPALAAGSAGDVRIAWMDARGGSLWNTYYRSSTDGGATWSAETDLSTCVGGLSCIQPGGFSFPFGDYFEMDIDDRGDTHAVWGEGLNYQTPGSIWYTRGR